jgi:hypothetical protein
MLSGKSLFVSAFVAITAIVASSLPAFAAEPRANSLTTDLCLALAELTEVTGIDQEGLYLPNESVEFASPGKVENRRRHA